MNENANSGKTIIIIAIIIVMIGTAGAWYFFMYKPEQVAKENARLEQIAKEEAAQKAKEQAAQNKIKYDSIIVVADSAFQQENWQEAQSLYAEASSLVPDEQYARDQLALVNAKLDEMASSAERRAAGVVETISSATGRFYVIVSSSVDDDLAMDYAKKLAGEGNSVKIIAHNANALPFFGVSLVDFGSWGEAEGALSSYSEYASDSWVLKY